MIVFILLEYHAVDHYWKLIQSYFDPIKSLHVMLMLILFTLQVSNRRSRRWLNDRLLMELVPRLNAEEIRGLFAPPPFGNYIYE